MSPTILWLIAGGFFIAIEIFGVPGIGFLFAGIGAMLMGGAIEFGIIAAENTSLQFTLFFAISCISAAMMWKKLKTHRKPAYSNMIGTEAIVAAPGLVGNKEGQVKWSGTLMRARLVPNAGYDAVAEDTAVIIKQVEGNLLLVAPKP